MAAIIDAKGKACPMPVLMAKKEIDGGSDAFTVEVDNETAVRNLEKLAQSQGFSAAVSQGEGVYSVSFCRSGEAPAVRQAPAVPAAGGNWALFVGHDIIGDGDRELGTNLIRMFFYTLAQGDDLPKAILFMNGGVKLPALDDQVAEHLKVLEGRGCEIYVCGTCLNFFGIADQLKVGSVSNMYDISKQMLDAAKVITL